MIDVKISVASLTLKKILLRQTPNHSGVWGNIKFHINEDVKCCDWWIVLHESGLKLPEFTYCDPLHTVYISMEPDESIVNINEKFIKQFAHVVLVDRKIRHKNIIPINAITWWVGIIVDIKSGGHKFEDKIILDYDRLMSMVKPNKHKKISIINSSKSNLIGHKKRTNFIEWIVSTDIGKYIDVYGNGFNKLNDKWDAIVQYEYHIVIENVCLENYWSEKIADAYLGFSMPIYYGCKNLDDFFDKNSYIKIDIENYNNTYNIIYKALESDLYKSSINSIESARLDILNRYNIFNIISNICDSKSSNQKKILIRPNWFYAGNSVKNIIKKIIYRL